MPYITETLNLPKHSYLTPAEYEALTEKDANTLYFIKGARLIYRGEEPCGGGIMTVEALPAAADALPDLYYCVTKGDEAGLYALDEGGDGFTEVTVTKKYVDGLLAAGADDGEKCILPGGAEALPWCSGIFKDRSLAGNVDATVTPVYEEGDETMISGNTFVANSSGLYILSTGGAIGAGASNQFTQIVYNGFIEDRMPKSYLSLTNANSTVVFPGNIRAVRLNKGDFISFGCYSYASRATFNAVNSTLKFTFILLTKED